MGLNSQSTLTFSCQFKSQKEVWQWEYKTILLRHRITQDSWVQQNVRYFEDTLSIFPWTNLPEVNFRGSHTNPKSQYNPFDLYECASAPPTWECNMAQPFWSTWLQIRLCDHNHHKRIACNLTRSSPSSPLDNQNHDSASSINEIMDQSPWSKLQEMDHALTWSHWNIHTYIQAKWTA